MLEWEVSLSNGETWRRKHLSKSIDDGTEFRRLLESLKGGDSYINAVKILHNGNFIHLLNKKSKIKPEYFWFETEVEFIGKFGGPQKIDKKMESLSYRIGDFRIYYRVNLKNNIWIEIRDIDDKKEKRIRSYYEC